MTALETALIGRTIRNVEHVHVDNDTNVETRFLLDDGSTFAIKATGSGMWSFELRDRG